MSDSDVSSVTSSDDDIGNMIMDQPIYHVLNQFLVTDDGVNVATCIENLTKEVSELRKLMSSFLALQKTGRS